MSCDSITLDGILSALQASPGDAPVYCLTDAEGNDCFSLAGVYLRQLSDSNVSWLKQDTCDDNEESELYATFQLNISSCAPVMTVSLLLQTLLVYQAQHFQFKLALERGDGYYCPLFRAQFYQRDEKRLPFKDCFLLTPIN